MWRRLDHGSGRPLYRQVADDIRDAIQSGDLPPGRLLPTEARLAAGYDTGVDVVRDALAVLRSEGLITTRRGKGSRVRDRMEVVVVPVPPGARISARMPTDEERQRFDLAEGTPLLIVEQAGDVQIFPADRTAVETTQSLVE